MDAEERGALDERLDVIESALLDVLDLVAIMRSDYGGVPRRQPDVDQASGQVSPEQIAAEATQYTTSRRQQREAEKRALAREGGIYE